MGNQQLIIDFIKRYIRNKQDLNSAIMIKGKWGCGKTYFVKKILGYELKEFLKAENKRLYYITLNGLSNTKELMERIQSVIVREAYGYFKNSKSESETIEIITGIDEENNILEIELKGPEMGVIIGKRGQTLDSLQYNGENYIGAPLTFDEIKKDDNSSVSKLNINLSNVGLAISGIIGQRGDVITNAPAVLTLVFLDLNTNELLPDYKKILYAGRCNNLKLDYENASMDIETSLGGYEVQAPVMKYRTTCQVRRFKDCRCGYTGEETECDRTFDRCKELGNEHNFRGFPQMYNELVIKV